MSLVTISTASINYTAGTTDCQCSVQVDVPTIGQTFVARFVSLESGTLPPDWTDDQLCAAVAVALDVPASDVSVAEGFALAAAAKANAPADTPVDAPADAPVDAPVAAEGGE